MNSCFSAGALVQQHSARGVLLLAGCLVAFAIIWVGWQPVGASGSGTRATSGGSTGQPVWGPDIQIAPIAGTRDLLHKVLAAPANPGATIVPATQKNPSVAINPTDPNNLIMGFDSVENNSLASGHAASTDGGLTWAAGRFTDTWGTGAMTPLGSTNVAFDSAGTGYYTSLAVNGSMSGYFLLTTTNGLSWSQPLPVIASDYSIYRSASHLVVDRSVGGLYTGSLYLFYLFNDNTAPYTHGVRMRYSRDGGLSWLADIQVSSAGHEYAYGPTAGVDSNGTVYLAFADVDNYNIRNPYKLYLTRSTDGGNTWAADTLITGETIQKIGGPDYKGRELTLLGGPNCALMRINHNPSLAVSPTQPGTVYVAWNDGRWEQTYSMCAGSAKHSDIALSRSTDGGATWSAVVRVNDDPVGNGVDQFQPFIAVGQDGRIGVSWYDRRFDPVGYKYDLEYSQSTDNGLTWSANERVSDVSSTPDNVPDYKGIDDLGARKAMVLGPDYALPVWLDTRMGVREGLLFTDRGELDGGKPYLVGHATWQGRPPQPDPLQTLPVTLTLKIGNSVTNFPARFTAASGVFTQSVAGLSTGTYSWRAKSPKFLANAGQVALTGQPVTSFEIGLMRAGDANNDDTVDLTDFGILRATYGKSQGDPGYDDRADLNGDHTVDLTDFGLMRANFGQSGMPMPGVHK